MAKKKDAEPNAQAAPEAPQAPAEKLTQREAVRRAIEDGAASPADGVPYVKEKFDITLTNQAFSTLKSQLKNGGGGKTAVKSGGKPGSTNGSANGAARAQAGNGTAAGTGGNPAELALAVKALVAAHGAETVKAMADVFAK